MIVTALIGGAVSVVLMMAMTARPSRLRLAQGRMRLGRLAGPTRADLFVDHEVMRGRLTAGRDAS